MVTNTLLLKLKDRSDENIAKAKDLLLSMEGRIEYLRKVKVEVDIRHGASSYDLLLITEFAAMEDFDAYIGELYISIDKAREQAEDYGHSFEREMGFLAVHGFLHINGYDHYTPEEEAEMFGLQEEILTAYGLTRE